MHTVTDNATTNGVLVIRTGEKAVLIGCGSTLFGTRKHCGESPTTAERAYLCHTCNNKLPCDMRIKTN